MLSSWGKVSVCWALLVTSGLSLDEPALDDPPADVTEADRWASAGQGTYDADDAWRQLHRYANSALPRQDEATPTATPTSPRVTGSRLTNPFLSLNRFDLRFDKPI